MITRSINFLKLYKLIYMKLNHEMIYNFYKVNSYELSMLN